MIPLGLLISIVALHGSRVVQHAFPRTFLVMRVEPLAKRSFCERQTAPISSFFQCGNMVARRREILRRAAQVPPRRSRTVS
jgi:hypothetical protein